MLPNQYDRDHLAQARRQNLLREAEHERRLAQLPPSNGHILAAPGRLIASLRAIQIRLWKGLKRRIA